MPLILGEDPEYSIYIIYHMGTPAGLKVSLEDEYLTNIRDWHKEFFNRIGFTDYDEFVSAYPGHVIITSKIMRIGERSKGRGFVGDHDDVVDSYWVLNHQKINDPLLASNYLVEQIIRGRADTFLTLPTIEEIRQIRLYRHEWWDDNEEIPDKDLWFCEDWSEM